MKQLTFNLKMTTTQVVETSVSVNNNSPIQDYLDLDDHAQPTDSWVQTLHCETCFKGSPSGFAVLVNRPQLFKRWIALFTG